MQIIIAVSHKYPLPLTQSGFTAQGIEKVQAFISQYILEKKKKDTWNVFSYLYSSFQWNKWSFKDDTFTFNILASQTNSRIFPWAYSFPAYLFPYLPLSEDIKKIYFCWCTGNWHRCKHTRLYFANRELKLYMYRGYERRPCPSAHVKVNMKKQSRTHICRGNRQTHIMSWWQSAAVNHDIPGWFYFNNHNVASNWWRRKSQWSPCFEYWGRGGNKEWKERNRCWWIHIIRLYNKWNISLWLHSLTYLSKPISPPSNPER